MKALSSSEFKDVICKDKTVLVDFYANWCLPCRYLQPVLEKFENEFNGKIEFYKLDIDKNREIAIEYGITSIPTVLIFRKGKVIGGFVGALPEEMVKKEIKKALD